MNKVTIPVSITMLVAAVFVATSASASTDDTLGTQTLQIITQGSGIAYPRFVRLEKTEHGLRIKGQLEKRTQSRRRYLGHVDLEFVDREGKILLTRTVGFSPSRWRKHQRARWFSVLIDDLPTETKVVRVKHHLGGTQHNWSWCTAG